MQLNTRLTLGLSEEDLEILKKSYTISRTFVDRFIKTLSKDLERSLKEGDDFSKFQNPNWALTQAYLSGQREALRTVINLLTIKE